MTKQTTTPKNARTQYSQSYKDDALALAERIVPEFKSEVRHSPI